MVQRLGNGEVRVVQLDILADKTDGDMSVGGLYALDQRLPLAQLRRSRPEAELAANDE